MIPPPNTPVTIVDSVESLNDYIDFDWSDEDINYDLDDQSSIQWSIGSMEPWIQKFGIKHEMTVSLALVVRQKSLTPVFQSKSDDSEIGTRILMKFKS